MTWIIMAVGVFLGLIFGIIIEELDIHFNEKGNKK